jgi:hypothetical protein
MRALEIKTTGGADLPRAGVPVLTFCSIAAGSLTEGQNRGSPEKINSGVVSGLTFAIKNSRQR